MVLETFYQTVAQLSFTLLGLWFLVLQTKYQEWIGSPTDRRMVTSIALYFFVPGGMSLFALLSAPSLAVWRAAFAVAGWVRTVAVAVFPRHPAQRPDAKDGPRGPMAGAAGAGARTSLYSCNLCAGP